MKIIYKSRGLLKEQETPWEQFKRRRDARKKRAPRRSKRKSITFSDKEVRNIMEASSKSGISPVWIAGMTKAESGGNCLSRAWNGTAILNWKRKSDGKNVAQRFGEDSEALKRAGLTKETEYSDHHGGNNSYFHRAYKIAPKTAVYVTAWGTNQVMGWELLRMGGISTTGPGGNPDKIVNEFFSNPCRVSTMLIASWKDHTAPPGWLKRANRAAKTGNISDWNWTTCVYLGDSDKKKKGCQRNSRYTNRIIAAAEVFKRDYLDKPPQRASTSLSDPSLDHDLRIQRKRFPRKNIKVRASMQPWWHFSDRPRFDPKKTGTLDRPVDFDEPMIYDYEGIPVPGAWPAGQDKPTPFPTKKQKVRVAPASKNLKNETIIMIGDSQMTDMYKTGIGVKLEKMLRARGANVYRFAKGSAGVNFWSETLAGRLSNLTNKHTKKLTLKYLKNLNPTQIIVSLGGNDHWRTKEHIKKHSGDLMEQLKSLGAPVIWYGPGDRSPSVPEGHKRNRVKQRREKVDRILGEIAQSKGIKYVSMLAFARDLYRHDKVHYYVPKGGTPKERQKGSEAVRKYAQEMMARYNSPCGLIYIDNIPGLTFIRARGGDYGTKEMVNYLKGLPNVGHGGWIVGDMSRWNCKRGPRWPHAGHVTGGEVDICIPTKDGRWSCNIIAKDPSGRPIWDFSKGGGTRVTKDTLDIERSLAFLEYTLPRSGLVILDTSLKKALIKAAKASGRLKLASLINRQVRYHPKHQDHFHVQGIGAGFAIEPAEPAAPEVETAPAEETPIPAKPAAPVKPAKKQIPWHLRIPGSEL